MSRCDNKILPRLRLFFFFEGLNMTDTVQRKESSAVRPPPPYSFPSAEIVGIESGRFVCALFMCVCARGFKFVCVEQLKFCCPHFSFCPCVGRPVSGCVYIIHTYIYIYIYIGARPHILSLTHTSSLSLWQRRVAFGEILCSCASGRKTW